jgi:hypothetical protein
MMRGTKAMAIATKRVMAMAMTRAMAIATRAVGNEECDG